MPHMLSISAMSVPATYTEVKEVDFWDVRKQTGENAR